MKSPYEFQIHDALQMLASGNCVNGSEPGVGKTAMAVQLIKGRTLIIVPKSVLYQFYDEILAFRQDIIPVIITGTLKNRKALYTSIFNLYTTSPILLTYETLRSDADAIAKLHPKFETIILDEVHRLANPKTKTHKALRYLLRYYATSDTPQPRMYGFTASLIMNSPMDVYGVYSILRPRLFPNFMYFTEEYMNRHPTFGYITGAKQSALPKLGRIIAPYFVRRTLAEVAPQLPPHIDEIVRFDLSPKETKLYNDIRQELLFSIDPQHIDLIKNPLSIQNALTKMQKLGELTLSPDLIGHSDIPSTKLEILKDKVNELLQGNTRKCVIYSVYARRGETLFLKDFQEYNPAVIVGGQTNEQREEQRIKFKTDPACRVMLLSKAGSEGISLEEASYLIRLDTPFSIGRDIQLTGRIRRITTVEPTFGFTLAARGTVDEKMLKILEKKKLINSSIFSPEDIEELLT